MWIPASGQSGRSRHFVAAALLAACSPAGEPREVTPPPGPFAVSDFFSPSGAMGDGATEGNVVTHVNQDCKSRPAGARGSCYSFVYKPVATPPSGLFLLWAGVYWQYPENNWGAQAGLPIRGDKLTKISFQAAVANGTETIKFVTGGIGVPADTTHPELVHRDQFKIELMQTVTTNWTKVESALPRPPLTTPTSLIGALAWFANYPSGVDPTTAAAKIIYIDDIVYE